MSAVLQQKGSIFDEFLPDKFKFQRLNTELKHLYKNQQISLKSKFQITSQQKDFKSQQYQVSLCENFLFLSKINEETSKNPANQNPDYYLDVEFSRLVVNKDNRSFTLKRLNRDYSFELLEIEANIESSDKVQQNQNQQINILTWLDHLNNYTIRELGNAYTVMKQIGKGSYSTVFKVLKNDDSKKHFALKVVKKQQFKDEQMREQLLKEIRIQRGLDCGNIVKLYQVQEDDKYVYLVLDFIEGGTLRDYLVQGVFSEDQIRQITLQLLLSIDYMHRKNIIHRDLKPENILLSFEEDKTRPDAYLADFGFAVKLSNESALQSIYGTPGYVAPEVLQGQPYSYKADMFSLGAILYNMVVGKNLFIAKTAQEALIKNIKCNVDWLIQELDCSLHLKDILQQILDKNPERRLFASQALQHQWFNKQCNVIQFSLLVNENEAAIESENAQLLKLRLLQQTRSKSFKRDKTNGLTVGIKNAQLTPQINKYQNSNLGSQYSKSQKQFNKKKKQFQKGCRSQKYSKK
eukprot:403363288